MMLGTSTSSTTATNVLINDADFDFLPSPTLATPAPPALNSRSTSLPMKQQAIGVSTVSRTSSSPNLSSVLNNNAPKVYSTSSTHLHLNNRLPSLNNINLHHQQIPSINRISNSSSNTVVTSSTTTTSDRSSTASSGNNILYKSHINNLHLPPNNFVNTNHNNNSFITAIDIINDYADSVDSISIYSKSSAAKNPHIPPPKFTPSSKLNPKSIIQAPDSTRDRYGFKKASANISQAQYDQWYVQYEPYLRRRDSKWIKLMESYSISLKNNEPLTFPPRENDKLKRYVRKGIPAEWRGNAWFYYAGGNDLLDNNKGVYDRLCKETESSQNGGDGNGVADADVIERDLHRTFPDNVYFRSDVSKDGTRATDDETPMIASLRRVLKSFAKFRPKIGYCQSMNFIAGLLLLFLSEEKAFWMMVIITEKYLPGVHEVSLEGVAVDQNVLLLCLSHGMPKLYRKLVGNTYTSNSNNHGNDVQPPFTLCTAAWFMSVFIGTLPIESVLRIWDILFLEDSKTLFRVALTIFKLCERKIEALSLSSKRSSNGELDPMEIFSIIQTEPRKMIDVNELLHKCYTTRKLKVNQIEIERLRKIVRDRRNAMKLAATKNIEKQTDVGIEQSANRGDISRSKTMSKIMSIRKSKRHE